MTKDAYDRTLARLVTLLKRQPMTARAISDALHCCRPAAYQRLKALELRGHEVYTVKAPVRESVTGPRSVAYGIR